MTKNQEEKQRLEKIQDLKQLEMQTQREVLEAEGKRRQTLGILSASKDVRNGFEDTRRSVLGSFRNGFGMLFRVLRPLIM